MRRVLARFFAAAFIITAASAVLAKEKGDEKTTGNVVSQAVHKAQQEGLKGQELAAQAHEAIEQRKEAKEAERFKVKEERMKKKAGRKMGRGKK